ncbi:MAG TPA: NAD(P)/FAD-dependent oxidoreductase [Acidimicrobiales bacterium]|nr:NAD(P)/FAD-dependent oxidoreductase [Acidimicrobiales bacterium]
MSARPKVVVVGSGFGGLAAVDRLARLPVDITLVDRDNYHGFWPLLYQVASAELAADDIATPIRAIQRDRRNVEVRLATVRSVDLDRRVVHLEPGDGPDLPYDHLIVAAGSSTTDFGVPGVAEHAFPLKTLPDAIELRNHLLRTFEQAEAAAAAGAADGQGADTTARPPAGPLSIVIVGGGTTGVEMAGAVAELIRHNLAGDFRRIDVAHARVVVVEMTDHLLGGFSARSQAAARATLVAHGVELRLGTAIASIDADGVVLRGGERIAAATVVWTAGVRANPLADVIARAAGLQPAKGGRLPVGADLALPGYPEVSVIGDCSGATDRHGRPYPQVAQVAIQQGRHAARTVGRRLDGRAARPFRYLDHGSMATIGRRSAVAELPGGLVITGTVGWLAWLVVHLVFLVGSRNRAVVLTNWAWNYLTWDRGARVIVDTDDRAPAPSGSVRA